MEAVGHLAVGFMREMTVFEFKAHHGLLTPVEADSMG